MKLPGLSVVVPVYNSEGSLRLLVERLESVAARVATEYELILVNDGSRDSSWSVIEELAAKYEWIRGIRLMRNYGQHNALLCGIRAARFDWTLTMDDDLQHPPEEIPRLIAALRQQEVDVLYGAPRKEPHSLLRGLASRMTKWALQAAMGAETAGRVSAFRLFRTNLRDAFADYRSPFVSIDVLLTWGTTRFGWCRVRHDPRAIGQSNYTIRKLLVHATNMITGYSTAPLRLASIVGFLFFLFGVVLFLFIVGRYLIQGTTVAGFPFLASTIAIFSGAQLFALGIIGEYLSRIFSRTTDRPVYTIAEVRRGGESR